MNSPNQKVYKQDILPVVYVDITQSQYRAEGYIHLLWITAGGMDITYMYIHVHQFDMVYIIHNTIIKSWNLMRKYNHLSYQKPEILVVYILHFHPVCPIHHHILYPSIHLHKLPLFLQLVIDHQLVLCHCDYNVGSLVLVL